MSVILHHLGAYNLYSTVADGPLYSSALTLNQLKNWMKLELGAEGLRQLPERLKRAHETGTSSCISNSLEDEVCCNRAGPNEAHLSFEKFVDQFLTYKSTNIVTDHLDEIDWMKQRIKNFEEVGEMLVDYGDCQYDHHDFCQTHGMSRRPCRMELLRKLLREKKK